MKIVEEIVAFLIPNFISEARAADRTKTLKWVLKTKIQIHVEVLLYEIVNFIIGGLLLHGTLIYLRIPISRQARYNLFFCMTCKYFAQVPIIIEVSIFKVIITIFKIVLSIKFIISGKIYS